MMRYLIATAALGAAALALSSCATLNEEQCQVVDWQQLGQSDGAQGQPSTYIARHQEACTRFGITVNAAAWQSGWESGIRSYCTPSNGLSVGLSGGVNRNACPADLAARFNEAYRVGDAVHDARSRRDETQREIDRLIRELSAATEDAERTRIQVELELARNRLSTAQADVARTEREADLYRLRLSQASQSFVQ
ncbi:DUF2799 domain-containing protein [Roseitalea porphyridii]|uniref:DUF2799 domain-containing protein n=1 Tax=Roseitalea porphyridii TaxID=1852022 RepID=A0A4P6V0S7_9HYPH|nr:DUF2799 domain-containing protein [Roseitalea porphyridii]QBK30254.1 DUF2799 domain-containing protein [Roseitalea porphyridii]